jgi:hypothetical protein
MLIGVDEPQTTTTSDPELLFEEARALQRRRQKRQTTALSIAGILVILGVGAYRIVQGDHAARAPRPQPIIAVARRPAVIYEKVETVVSTPHLPMFRRTGQIWFSPRAPGTYRELLTIVGGPTVEVGAAPGHDLKLGNEMIDYLYDAKTTTIYETGAYLEPSAPPATPPPRRQAFRHFLLAPGVRLEGTRVLDGHTVYVAVFHSIHRSSLTRYIDTATHRTLLAVSLADGTRVTTRVLAYRTLPATPTNLDLTSLVRAHSGARVVQTWPPPPRIHQLYGDANQIGNVGPDLGPFG